MLGRRYFLIYDVANFDCDSVVSGKPGGDLGLEHIEPCLGVSGLLAAGRVRRGRGGDSLALPLNRQPGGLLEVACLEDNQDLVHLKEIRDEARAKAAEAKKTE